MNAPVKKEFIHTPCRVIHVYKVRGIGGRIRHIVYTRPAIDVGGPSTSARVRLVAANLTIYFSFDVNSDTSIIRL